MTATPGAGHVLTDQGRVAFRLLARDPGSAARAGELVTPHGVVPTPAFLPVGTQATVKTMTPAELVEIGVPMILGNAYHLYLRPGAEVVAQAGGLHRFMGWDGPILTDSGGYQVFSLAARMRVDDDGVSFRSHIDGSAHRFTPELVVDVQQALGADVRMPLDHCLPNPAPHGEAAAAVERTTRWLERSLARERSWRERGDVAPGALFGIVQGATYPDLRRASAGALTDLGVPGLAVGGLAVGEPRETMLEVLEGLEPHLDGARPRYLMGVGFPADLVDAVERGMDLFDCVAPTRHGRNGTLFTRDGRLNIRAAANRRDHGPVDPACGCRVCATTSRAYLRHLFDAREVLGLRLATYHNVHVLTELLRQARAAVLAGRFSSWASDVRARSRRPAEGARGG